MRACETPIKRREHVTNATIFGCDALRTAGRKKKKTLVGLLIELHCAGERIRREGTAALVSFTAELPRRLLPGRCQDSRSLVAGEGTPY